MKSELVGILCAVVIILIFCLFSEIVNINSDYKSLIVQVNEIKKTNKSLEERNNELSKHWKSCTYKLMRSEQMTTKL